MFARPIPFRRSGQGKPWSSIPRIDWSHPLAKGLVFYAYDTGGAGPIDLVTGCLSTVLNTNPAKPTASAYGPGLKYVAGQGSRVFAVRRNALPMFTTGIYSAAMGFMTTGFAVAGNFAAPFHLSAAAATTDCSFLFNQTASGDYQWSLNNVNPTPIASPAITLNAYHTLLGTNTAANTQSIYLDGASVGTTALTSAFTTTTDRIAFNSWAPTTTSSGNQYNGWVFWGAHWNRTITPQEAAQLHVDPYCFLIYPEDELFQMLVGVAGGTFSVTTDFGAVAEFLSGVRGDIPSVGEFLSSLRADQAQQMEVMTAVSRDSGALVEFIAGIRGNMAAPSEFSGLVRADVTASSEITAAVSVDAIATTEVLMGRRTDMTGGLEVTAAVRSDTAAPAENLGALSVVSNAAVQLETTGAFRSDASAGSEASIAVRSDVAASSEILVGVATQMVGLAEFTAAAAAHMAASLETTAAFRSDVTGSIETVAGVRSDALAGAEVMVAVMFNASASVESTAGVVSDSAAQAETQGGVSVSLNSVVQIEFQGVAASLAVPYNHHFFNITFGRLSG